jgi:hypothetical protein
MNTTSQQKVWLKLVNLRTKYTDECSPFSLQHQVELDIILKYSPFKSESELLGYFDKIQTKGRLLVF